MTVQSKEQPVTLNEDGKILEIHVTGKLGKSDYDNFLPRIETLMKAHGKVRMLLYLHEFHGWSVGALWEDLKFDAKHFNDIERLAIVGESKWQEGMSAFCKPFTTAEIKYFDHDQLPAARQWVQAE